MTPSAEATAKISISLMLIRITTSTKWKRFFYFLIVLFMSVTIMCFFGIILSCIPIQRLWDPSVAGSCNISERTGILYVQGSKHQKSLSMGLSNVSIQSPHPSTMSFLAQHRLSCYGKSKLAFAPNFCCADYLQWVSCKGYMPPYQNYS